MQTPNFYLGHANLHAATLICIRPTNYHTSSPLQLVFGREPNIYHLRIFGCAVYVPISLPHCTKTGPQKWMVIYVGYDSPSIIKYLEPTTWDLLTARFVDCHFDESNFSALGGKNKKLEKDISWNELSLSHLDSQTKQYELEVQKIIHWKILTNQLPNAFTDPKNVTKSYIPIINAPIKMDVPVGQSNESQPCLKRGRPINFKDKNLWTRKEGRNKDGPSEDIEILKESSNIIKISTPE